ncbi:MAG: oxidoreductase, family [Deltaproteobacteria bacterium]|nr:oxidoreductase, family [Deltaproteobacteria bacterium]
MAEHDHRAYLLTGVTGFLGSHLMALLLQRGSRVLALGRRADGRGLNERVKSLLEWFRIAGLSSRLEVFEADLVKPDLGLDLYDYRKVRREKPVIIHCASDTRFSERNRRASTEINVHSLKGIIRLAKDSGSPFFHYISTAYVAGRSLSTSYEIPVADPKFSNVYEETKGTAEKEVSGLCAAHGIPYAITRPSIVYGDSRTGRSNRFNALYYHVRSLQIIRDIYTADILERSGTKSDKLGIHLGPDGTLHMPLRIFVAGAGYINLIPIDYFTAAMAKILENARPGSIYHATDDNPKTIGQLAGYCERFLNMKGIQIIYGNQNGGPELNPPEEVFNKLIQPYLPYLCDTRRFDKSNTLKITGGLATPEITYEVFERCMNYAVSVSWGKRGRTL